MPLKLYVREGGHFFYDSDLGVGVGQAYQREDGTWLVELSDSREQAVADLEEAKRVFVANYDPAKVNPGFGAMPGEPESPYDYCTKREDGRWVVYDEGEDCEHVVDSEVEAINLVKRVNEGILFEFVGLEGEEEETENSEPSGFQVIDLSGYKP
ncbi:MAG TPA: hypothetical protein VHA77_12785 [Xanthobacteraceae bacterium]|jgi:hypothetical protein|nr:hypothetical protein [Xanthobacteraceae bacterium]